eukprot:1841730-Rhodomonas_salina.1
MTGKQPDISWFRAFGCSAVVFQGKDLVEHQKLAPSGESGVFVGLGLMMGSKAWLIYSAQLNTIYASTNCTFDETRFPARAMDQRAYGYYYSEPTMTFRADMHDKQLHSTLRSDFLQFQDSHGSSLDVTAAPSDPASLSQTDPVWLPEHMEDSDGMLSQAPTVQNSPISEHDLQFPGLVVKEHARTSSAPDDTSMSGWG